MAREGLGLVLSPQHNAWLPGLLRDCYPYGRRFLSGPSRTMAPVSDDRGLYITYVPLHRRVHAAHISPILEGPGAASVSVPYAGPSVRKGSSARRC